MKKIVFLSAVCLSTFMFADSTVFILRRPIAQPPVGGTPGTAETAWYTLDDNAADTNVIDSSASGFDCVLAGGNNTADISVAAVVGNGLDFDGLLDYVDCGNVLDGDTTEPYEYSFAFWLRSSGTGDMLVSKNSGASGTGFYVRLTSGGNLHLYWDSGTPVISTTSALAYNTGADFYVVATRTGDVFTVYVNNVQILSATTASFGAWTNTNDFRIAALDSITALPHDGIQDDVRVWVGHTLTTDERTWLYNSGSGRSTSLSTASF